MDSWRELLFVVVFISVQKIIEAVFEVKKYSKKEIESIKDESFQAGMKANMSMVKVLMKKELKEKINGKA